MQTHTQQTDVVIIGGGMAGLTAATYLARAGKRVTLFEKSANLGGRAATQNYEGYHFNRGVHALYSGGAASEIMREFGISYKHNVPKDVFFLQDQAVFPFPTSLTRLLRCGWLDTRDKLEFATMLLSLSKLRKQPLGHVSVEEWLNNTLRRPRVRQFWLAFAKTYTYSAALDMVSADVFVEKLWRSVIHPIHYIDGGWQTLVDSVRRVAEQAGTHIVSGTRVEAIEQQSGRVQGVRLGDGSLFAANSVIIATTPQEAAKLLPAHVAPALQKQLTELVPARVACLDVALKHLPNPRNPVVQDLNQPRFITAQSFYAKVAPEGGALIHLFKQLDPRVSTDPHEDERELEQMLDSVQPGWRDLVVKRIFLPRIEASGALPLVTEGGMAGRPAVQVSEVAHLYMAGDWAGPQGFLIDASMASARTAAQYILQQPNFAITGGSDTMGKVQTAVS